MHWGVDLIPIQVNIFFTRLIEDLQNAQNIQDVQNHGGNQNTINLLRDARIFFETERHQLTNDQLEQLRASLAPYASAKIPYTLFEKAAHKAQKLFFHRIMFKIKNGNEFRDKINIQLCFNHFVEELNQTNDFFNLNNQIKNHILENRRQTPRLFSSFQEELDEWKRLAKNHPIENELLNAVRFTSYEIKNGRPLAAPAQTLQARLNTFQNGQVIHTAEEAVEPRIHQLHQDRLYRLQNLRSIYREFFDSSSPNHVAPEPVGSKYFPRTYAWFVGAQKVVRETPGQTVGEGELELDSQIELNLQALAVQYNIRMISDIPPLSHPYTQGMFTHAMRLDYKPGIPCQFAQDFVDFSRNEIRIPSMNVGTTSIEKGQEYRNLMDSMENGRRERSPQNTLWNDPKNEGDLKHEIRGTPFEKDRAKKAIALANALDCQISMNLGYNEGGNCLFGQDRNGPYAILGLDSFAASKHLMERSLQELGQNRNLTEEEVKIALAIDLEIPVERIYFIEQPGEFHLDMSMAIIGNKKILLNDSVLAHEQFKNHPRRTEGMEPKRIEEMNESDLANAKKKKEFEDKIERQLKAQGFSVVRCAGKFWANGVQVMNFFNMISGTNQQGQSFIIGMGCVDEDYESKFKRIIHRHIPIPDQNIHFLNREASELLLEGNGGGSCVVKSIL